MRTGCPRQRAGRRAPHTIDGAIHRDLLEGSDVVTDNGLDDKLYLGVEKLLQPHRSAGVAAACFKGVGCAASNPGVCRGIH